MTIRLLLFILSIPILWLLLTFTVCVHMGRGVLTSLVFHAGGGGWGGTAVHPRAPESLWGSARPAPPAAHGSQRRPGGCRGSRSPPGSYAHTTFSREVKRGRACLKQAETVNVYCSFVLLKTMWVVFADRVGMVLLGIAKHLLGSSAWLPEHASFMLACFTANLLSSTNL